MRVRVKKRSGKRKVGKREREWKMESCGNERKKMTKDRERKMSEEQE